jgi:hypothetical protein
MASTLSDLLESTLIDIQHDTANNNSSINSNNNSVSAVSVLLSERRKLKDAGKAHQEEDYIRLIPLTSSSTEGHNKNTLLDQIATSNIDNITTTTSKNRTTTSIPITNVRKSKQQKGQAYNDKSLSKKASKQSRKDRVDKYKRSY